MSLGRWRLHSWTKLQSVRPTNARQRRQCLAEIVLRSSTVGYSTKRNYSLPSKLHARIVNLILKRAHSGFWRSQSRECSMYYQLFLRFVRLIIPLTFVIRGHGDYIMDDSNSTIQYIGSHWSRSPPDFPFGPSLTDFSRIFNGTL